MAAAAAALLARTLGTLGVPTFLCAASILCAVPVPGVSGVVNGVSGLLFGTAAGAVLFTGAATAGAHTQGARFPARAIRLRRNSER
jgi:uncharacterized membrane protein YdjX (TVP38/TMEM64 family)